MTGGADTSPALVNAFKAALLSQGSVALFIFVLLAFAWAASREALPPSARARLAALRMTQPAEPGARRLVRIGFGVLWIFDGLLQAQPAMVGGLLRSVVAPAAAGSPGWVLRVVRLAATVWAYHPVQAASGVVWIQVGLGLWLLASIRGRWSRVAGLVSAAWALVVWIFGEAFGSVLAPGLSWLTGAPGSALLYCAAGVLLALPEDRWRDPRLGHGLVRATGLFLGCMAVLQAWPGRGFWQGRLSGRPGPLAAAIDGMAAMRQPASLARLVAGFGSLVAAHGFVVNLTAVIILAGAGALLLAARPAVVKVAVVAIVLFSLADWVLVQDLGFFGGIGTDPGSMLPFALLVVGGYLAMAPRPSAVSAPVANGSAAVAANGTAAVAANGTAPAGRAPNRQPTADGPVRAWQRLLRLARSAVLAFGTVSTSAVIGLWAVGLMALGAIPITVAEVHGNAPVGSAAAISRAPSPLPVPRAEPGSG